MDSLDVFIFRFCSRWKIKNDGWTFDLISINGIYPGVHDNNGVHPGVNQFMSVDVILFRMQCLIFLFFEKKNLNKWFGKRNRHRCFWRPGNTMIEPWNGSFYDITVRCEMEGRTDNGLWYWIVLLWVIFGFTFPG
jgi:hypothetical protein